MGVLVNIDWAQVIAISAPFAIAWIMWTAKRWVEEVVANMDRKIEERTSPIQPTANGGKSLPDAITLISKVEHKIDRVHERIDTLHEKVNDVARDFEHLRGRFEQHIDDKA